MPQADGYVRIVTRNDTSEAERSTEQLGDAIADAMDTSSVDRMSRAVDGLGDTLGDVDSSAVDGLRDGIDDVGSAAVTAGELIQANLISDIVMKGLEQLSGSLKDAAVHTVEVADGLDSSVKRVAAATNATEAEMQSLEAVIEQVYKDNFGDGFDDIADSVAKIKQNLGELDDSEIIEVTESAYALFDLFDAGVDQSSRAARAIMQNFGVSAAAAYDYMARGAQNGLDYSGELLDTISEYSVHFKELGFTLDDMFNIMETGAENGAWKLDTVGDLIKELSITAIDGSDSTKQAFELLGLEADDMAAKFAAGGEKARQAFEETLDAIAAMEDPIKQDAAGAALMKTMWEDLGRDAVISLAGITDSAYEATGAMDGIKEMNYSALSDHLGELRRKIDLMIEPIGEKLIPVIDEVADTVSEIADSGELADVAAGVGEFIAGTLTLLLKNLKLILSAVTGITSAIIAFKTAALLTKVISSWQTAALQVKLFAGAQSTAALQTAATNGTLTAQEIIYSLLSGKIDIATAKTALLNTTMAANPAAIIATAVGLLAAALTGFALCAGDAKDETEDYSKSLEELKKNIDSTIEKGEAELDLIRKKADRYEELRKSVDLTAAEQAELKGLAAELQNVLGSEVDVVNELTGEYNDLAGAVDNYVQKERAAIKLRAYEENAVEAQKKINEIDEKIDEKMSEKFRIDESVRNNPLDMVRKVNLDNVLKEIDALRKERDGYQAELDAYFSAYAESMSANAAYTADTEVFTPGASTADYYRSMGEEYNRQYEEKQRLREEEAAANEERFRQERELLDYQHDMELISEEEYYTQLAALRDKYLLTNSDEWRSVNVEIKKHYDSLSEEQQKAYDKRLSEQQKADDEAAKARTAAYNEERSQLQFRLKTNQITEKQYYSELAKIRDKYLDKNSAEWRNAYLEAYQYNQQIIQDNKDTLTQMLSDAADTTLAALENVTSARNGMASKLMDFNKTFEKVTETVPETIAVKGDFTITTAEHEVESYRMDADSVEDNIKVLEDYGAMLDALKARGADDATMSEILAMDIDEAMEFGSQLLGMSDKEWSSYFDSMAKYRDTANEIAEKYYQSEVDNLRSNFIDKVRSELDGLDSDMYNIGADVAAQFVTGWNEALGTKDLTVGELMRAVSSGTMDTAPKAAQQLTASKEAAAGAEASAKNSSSTYYLPIYIGGTKLTDIIIDAINGKIVQTGKNVLKG